MHEDDRNRIRPTEAGQSGREQGGWERREGEWGRGAEEHFGGDRLGREGDWGDRREATSEGLTHGYQGTMGGRDFGREPQRGDYDREHYLYGRGGETRGDYAPSERDVGGYRPETQAQRRWHREALAAREIMTPDVKTVTRDSSLIEVATIMKEEDVGIVPVVDAERKLQGVITDRDIVIRALAEGKNPMESRVGDLMTDDVDAVTPDEEVRDVIELMGKKQVRRVPVVDKDDRLLGIISMGDIANRADYDEDLQEALEDISAKRSFWSRLWS